MKNFSIAGLTLAAFLFPSLASAAVDDDNAFWGIVSTGDRIRQDGADTRWRYGFAAQWRSFQRGSGSDQYLLRSSMGYDIRTGMTLWAGFDYFQTDPDGGSTRFERRYWEQFSWAAHRWDWGSLSLRSRLEQRDLENTTEISHRFRQLAQLSIPLQNSSMTAILSAEHMTNLNDTDSGARSGFDQLRSYAGLRVPLGGKTSLEGGYMHQYINRPVGNYAVNHTAMLHLRFSFR